jgi:glycosyltransferase involved in cell wall biosynthesis
VLLLLTLDKWTGSAKRTYEILKRGKEHGIDYIVAFDEKCFYPSLKRYPFYADVLKYYNVYLVDLSCFRTHVISTYKERWKTGISLSKIAKQEKVDLILSPSEAEWMCMEAFFASVVSGVPWTAIWQGVDETLVATPNRGAITPFNVFSYINSKPSYNKSRLSEKITLSFNLLNQLGMAEKTLLLTVSSSVIEQVLPLNPRLKFHVIHPGIGITLKKYQNEERSPIRYQAIFFARLVPEKGLFDLPIIWKLVTMKFPDAKLAVAGEGEQRFIEKFRELVYRENLIKKIIFLGMLNETELIRAVKSSFLTLYPSLFDTASLTVLESLACGVPVVAYDISAIRHNYRKCGAILRCPIEDTPCMERNKLSKIAKDYVSDYDWNYVVEAEKRGYINTINRA